MECPSLGDGAGIANTARDTRPKSIERRLIEVAIVPPRSRRRRHSQHRCAFAAGAQPLPPVTTFEALGASPLALRNHPVPSRLYTPVRSW